MHTILYDIFLIFVPVYETEKKTLFYRKPSQAKPSQAKPSQAKPSQAKPS